MRDRRPRRSAAGAAIALTVVLAGCGGGPVQPEASSSGAAALFTVTYRAKDGTVTSVDVPVESTRCRNLGETPFYSTSGPDGTVAAAPTGITSDGWNLVVSFGDGLRFVNDEPFEVDEDGFTVAGLSGRIGHLDSGSMSDVGATEASVSGELRC
jgi:hypothetical protein